MLNRTGSGFMALKQYGPQDDHNLAEDMAEKVLCIHFWPCCACAGGWIGCPAGNFLAGICGDRARHGGNICRFSSSVWQTGWVVSRLAADAWFSFHRLTFHERRSR